MYNSTGFYMADGSTFTWNSAYFTYQYGNTTMTIEGYDKYNTGDRQLLYSDTIVIGQSPVLYTANWTGVNHVYYNMQPFVDDISFNNAPVAPEPLSSTLFIIGGALFGFRRFREKT